MLQSAVIDAVLEVGADPIVNSVIGSVKLIHWPVEEGTAKGDTVVAFISVLSAVEQRITIGIIAVNLILAADTLKAFIILGVTSVRNHRDNGVHGTTTSIFVLFKNSNFISF